MRFGSLEVIGHHTPSILGNPAAFSKLRGEVSGAVAGRLLTDVQGAVGLGIIQATSANDPQALSQMIDRELMLTEVTRFPPAEPTSAAIDQQVQTMRMHAGPNLDALMHSTGLDETRLQYQCAAHNLD